MPFKYQRKRSAFSAAQVKVTSLLAEVFTEDGCVVITTVKEQRIPDNSIIDAICNSYVYPLVPKVSWQRIHDRAATPNVRVKNICKRVIVTGELGD